MWQRMHPQQLTRVVFVTNQLGQQRVAVERQPQRQRVAGFVTNQLVGSAPVRGVHNSAAHVLAL
jgi:ketopantoate reductase